MIYIPKKIGGTCLTCGIKLPVPSWSFCMLHDCTRKKTVDTPFVKLKEPETTEIITKRTYEKHIPAVVLDKKKFTKRPFDVYLGYTINIPFNHFIDAKELIVDDDNWAIIGWK